MTQMDDENPWPYKEIWWCVCAIDDCHASLFGPFVSVEEADKEANPDKHGLCENASPCDNPHFAIKGHPPVNRELSVNSPSYNVVGEGASRWNEAMAGSKYRTWWQARNFQWMRERYKQDA